MPFSHPTLQEIIDRIAADIESRLPGADVRTRRSNLAVLTRVQAGAVYGLYGYLDWLALQLMPDTAEADVLERWANIWGIARQPATAATGDVTLTGNSGAVVPAGVVLQRADGAQYTTDAEVILAAGAATATITATDAGAAANTAAGTVLSFVSPVTGVGSSAIVTVVGLGGGADAETDDALRARLLARLQAPPQGGSASDYVAWAFAAHPSVTRAWVYPLELGAGTVTVRAMTDDATVDGVPTQAVIDAVQAYIDERRPVTAQVTVVAPAPVALDFTIQALTPSTQTVKDAITAELADLLRRAAAPGATILLSHIREAISTAAGETDHELVAPAANVAHAIGEIAVMGAVTWL